MTRVLNVERIKWTTEKDNELLELFAAGLPKSEIAQEMGTSISGIEARYRKLRKEQKNGN